MTDNWYYSDGDEPFGPISLDDVSTKIRQTIGKQHLVWKEGMTDWQSARESPAFASIFVTPPPLPEPAVTLKSYSTLQEHRHPWRRYFARILDLYIWVILGSFGIGLMFPGLFENSYKQNDVLLNLIMVAVYIPVEAFCLYAFGTTVGKSLYKINIKMEGGSITMIDGFRRAFAVYARGMGAGIPIVALFTLISAYNTLKSKGITSWDAQYHWIVAHGELKTLGWAGIIFAWVVFGSVLLALVALGSR
jgi:hypothetical protein